MTYVTRDLGWSVDGCDVLRGIDLAIRPGAFTGVLGPNGSGKSTLLHLLAGLRRPTRGSIRLGGADLRNLPAGDRARRIALVEQEAATDLDLTAYDVVELGRTPHRGRWARSAEGVGAFRAAMEAADVVHLAGRRWQTMSGGERQRTHLARALAQEPEVLLLDEPTNHLDLGHQLDFLCRVRGLGVTTVAALHDLESAAAFCDDLVVLDRGRLVAAGPVLEVLTADLVAQVYGVKATVEEHPEDLRPHLRWSRLGLGSTRGDRTLAY